MARREHPVHRRRLIDLSRLRGGRYKPPPLDVCTSDEVPLRLPEPGHELLVWAAHYRNLIVDFTVTQRRRLKGGWQEVSNIYLDHGVIVAEQHFRAADATKHQELLNEIPAKRGWEVVDNAYVEAVRMMQDRWQHNLRRWNGDSA